jgi:hypothetical protein
VNAVKVDKFASATARAKLSSPVTVEPRPFPKVGDVIVVRALTENPAYPHVELTSGRRSVVRPGDVIAGVIGSRQALRGFVGYAPMKVNAEDELYLLNMGGVVGRFIDAAPDYGRPVRVKVLGMAVRDGCVVNIGENAIPPTPFLPSCRPIVLVIGTCMNVGKTVLAVKLIQELAGAGRRVAAAKCSGVAALKDIEQMKQAGAQTVLSFLDCGFPSTVDVEDMPSLVKGILQRLNETEPDLIVVELGDGILGHYHVDDVLVDPVVMNHVAVVAVCAGDLVGAYGAKEVLAKLGVTPTVFSGPATDNVAGSEYIEERLGIRAINVMKNPPALCNLVVDALRAVKVEK